jgi:hypothetical protein
MTRSEKTLDFMTIKMLFPFNAQVLAVHIVRKDKHQRWSIAASRLPNWSLPDSKIHLSKYMDSTTVKSLSKWEYLWLESSLVSNNRYFGSPKLDAPSRSARCFSHNNEIQQATMKDNPPTVPSRWLLPKKNLLQDLE